MRTKQNVCNRILSLMLCLVLMLSYLPTGLAFTAAAADTQRLTDKHTLDQWQNFFGVQTNHPQNVSLTTEFAGGVWTDKSVFTPGDVPTQLTDATYNGNGFSLTDKGDNFLVALSAMASNKQIKGYSTIPTDTVLVLDLSSSMRSTGDNNTSAVDELADAANEAITELLALNKNNRVAVVVYAGNVNKNFTAPAQGNVQVLLPLDSYTTTTTGEYLAAVSSDRALEVVSGVKNSAGTAVSANRFETATGTFMQDGIYEGMRLLLGADTVVQEGVQAGTNRLPIMVLMSDGEPTLANSDYNGNDARTDLGTSELYTYDGTTGDHSFCDTIAFLTSLTAAYAKKAVAAHYGTEALMYTLAYGQTVLNRPEAMSVLNPANASEVQNTLWNSFLNGESVRVFRTGSRYNYQYVTTANSTKAGETLTAADRLYVDGYFAASND
ncbi:MAG: VWA domain-containing protein, partial [Clostridia bacterium]|nr:VWA domain-containing protein [Clostridia bacterium]